MKHRSGRKSAKSSQSFTLRCRTTSSEICFLILLHLHFVALMQSCTIVCLSERLLREREILEERAEKRLEIFKNLINKMATSTSGSDAQKMVKKKHF